MDYSAKMSYSSNTNSSSSYAGISYQRQEVKKMTCCNSRLRGQQCPNCPYR